MECKICLTKYDSAEIVPHVGSCGHTLCRQCTRRIATNCPFCREERAFVSSRVNYDLLEIVENQESEMENVYKQQEQKNKQAEKQLCAERLRFEEEKKTFAIDQHRAWEELRYCKIKMTAFRKLEELKLKEAENMIAKWNSDQEKIFSLEVALMEKDKEIKRLKEALDRITSSIKIHVDTPSSSKLVNNDHEDEDSESLSDFKALFGIQDESNSSGKKNRSFLGKIGRLRARMLNKTDQCVLKKYDIWEPNIQEYVNLKAGDEVCRSNFTIITFLDSGQLKVKADNYYCEGRCVSRKHNTANNYGKWQNDTEFKYECEFVEARCAVGNNSEEANFTYGMIHSQIFKQETPNPKQNNSYNVFVIMIDSLGMSQAYRNLPKTMNFLEKSLEAVTFPHINKVGANSRPNAFALWFGIQLEPIDRTLFGLPTVPVDRTWEDTCDTWLDNETIIFDEFNSQGYKTMLADESASSAEIYPYCKGLQRSFLTHKFQPFKIAKELESPLLNSCYRDENCVFFHKDMLKYQQQFIDAYKGYPKFSWIWSLIGHDDESKSMKLDTDILEFLLNNRKVLDESFLVIIGDHGLRHGGNAQNLQTHYDVRATFLDIARYQPKSEFSDLEPLIIPNEKGQSLFRKQIGERSCRTLPIPFDYCICEMEMKKFDGDLSKFENAGKEIVATVNTMLSEKKLTEICHQWTFFNASSMSVYFPIEKQVYSAVVYSNSPIGTAQFSAIFRLNSDGNYVAGNIDRVDSFGNRGNCVKGQRQMNKLCDCKEQKSR